LGAPLEFVRTRPRHRQRDEASGIYTKTRPWADRAIVLECPTAHRSRIAVRSLRLHSRSSVERLWRKLVGGPLAPARWPCRLVCFVLAPVRQSKDNSDTAAPGLREGRRGSTRPMAGAYSVRNHSHRAALRLAWFLCKEGKLNEGVERRNLNTCKADASESWKSCRLFVMLQPATSVARTRRGIAGNSSIFCIKSCLVASLHPSHHQIAIMRPRTRQPFIVSKRSAVPCICNHPDPPLLTPVALFYSSRVRRSPTEPFDQAALPKARHLSDLTVRWRPRNSPACVVSRGVYRISTHATLRMQQVW
jgi:hypothetical protein